VINELFLNINNTSNNKSLYYDQLKAFTLNNYKKAEDENSDHKGLKDKLNDLKKIWLDRKIFTKNELEGGEIINNKERKMNERQKKHEYYKEQKTKKENILNILKDHSIKEPVNDNNIDKEELKKEIEKCFKKIEEVSEVLKGIYEKINH